MGGFLSISIPQQGNGYSIRAARRECGATGPAGGSGAGGVSIQTHNDSYCHGRSRGAVDGCLFPAAQWMRVVSEKRVMQEEEQVWMEEAEQRELLSWVQGARAGC